MTVAAPPTDLLSDAVAYVRPHLAQAHSVGDRLRALWAGVFAARELAAVDVVEDEFLRLGRDSGLSRDLGRDGDENLRHVIRWALLEQSPFC
jgi:hypothetical protein